MVTLSAAASSRTRLVSSAATTSAVARAAASRGGASSGRPMGTPASVRTPPPARLVVSGSLSRPLPFALPTRASIHIALRAMTATAAGQPAMDPEDSGSAGAEAVSDTVGDGDDLAAARPGGDQAAYAAARIAALRG